MNDVLLPIQTFNRRRLPDAFSAWRVSGYMAANFNHQDILSDTMINQDMGLSDNHQWLPDKEYAVRKMLRVATHPHHLRLHRHPLLIGLTQRDLSLMDYRKLLLAYFHLYSALEGCINQFLKLNPGIFEYAERCKLPWLVNDLAFFQEDVPTLGHNMLPAPGFPEIDGVGRLVGVLYVIEGATLGGQKISHSLAEYHGLTGYEGACFFNGYGERTSSMWQDFMRFAENISSDVGECRAAVESACRTFQFFTQVLDAFVHEERNAFIT